MPEESSLSLVDKIIRKGASVGVAVVEEVRRKVLSVARQRLPTMQAIALIRRIIAQHEPILSRAISDTILAGWLTGAKTATTYLPDEEPSIFRLPPVPPIPPDRLLFPAHGGDEPIVRFPIIEEAADYLRRLRVYSQEDYNSLSTDAKRSGFTVARVASLDALQKIQDALVEDVETGGTLKAFVNRVDEALGAGALSRPRIENVYRDNTAKAYSRGLIKTLGHPMVNLEFPYLRYSAVHDSRTEPEHLAMEKLGLDQTAVYRRDDPIWQRFLPPWRWSCRCAVIPLTVEQAAALGVREAIEWLATGNSPAQPEWVAPPPFNPPPGFVTSGQMPAIV